jgi:hypothetical protein
MAALLATTPVIRAILTRTPSLDIDRFCIRFSLDQRFEDELI